MQFDSCSFNIGENTLLEIERQAKVQSVVQIKTPLTSKNQKQSYEDKLVDPGHDDVIEESPNAKENIDSFCHRSLRDRLRNATQRGRERRRLEKSKSTSFLTTTSNNISTISKYLNPEEIDFSAWEIEAAKLISPAVRDKQVELKDYTNLQLDCSASQDLDLFSDELQTLEFNIEELPDNDDVLNENGVDTDNVTFTCDVQETEQFIEEQKSRVNSIVNDSVLTHSQVIQVASPDLSLTIDATKDLRFLSSWNLPPSVVNEYRKKNVSEMFEWQCECLKNPKILFEGANLVYSAPTSAGKTLVSEILMIKNIVERKKKALFILPFVSVVREKMFYLQDLMASSGLRVEGFFGGYQSPPGGFDSIDLAVCTIEKANSIVNKLLEQNKLSEIGMIVVDEIHLISDSSRGYILELLLTKILYMCQKFQHKIQIVTMSATLPNVDLLRNWLSAEFFTTDFRPIELKEMIKIGKNLFDTQLQLLRIIDEKYKEFFPNDADEVCELAIETMMENCQLIVFCPSKEWCEQLCTNLSRGIHAMIKKNILEDVLDKKKIESLVEQAKSLVTGVDQILLRSFGYGCAFHHAGLTTDERDLIEMGFKDGSLKALFATSTLSSGVNLPARRVIIRTPMFGKKMMSNLTYRQMIGRAGRKGKDILGESILICNEVTSKIGKQLVGTPLDPIASCLDVDNHAHLKRALLEIIASGVANTKNDLESFVNSTLFCQQNKINFSYFESEIEEKFIATNIIPKTQEDDDPIKSSMDFLLNYEFIRIHKDDESNEKKFVPTRLGLACLSSSMPPKDGFLLFSELQKARQNFVLESELHAIYLVTPFSVAYQLQDLDWIYFAEMYDKLPEMMKRVGAMVGVSDTYLIKAITGKQGSDWKAQQIHKRFYTALALQDLVNEKSIAEVSGKFKIHRGILQNLQQMSSTFAGVVTTFCKSLGADWNLLALILTQFRERLFFGIHPDLIDLMKIPSMTSTRIARALYKSGIEKLCDLANSKTLQVENVLIDLGESFFVAGKSIGMNVQEVAKLLIVDARNHITNEMGLKNAGWSQNEENVKKNGLVEEEEVNLEDAITQHSSFKDKKILKAVDRVVDVDVKLHSNLSAGVANPSQSTQKPRNENSRKRKAEKSLTSNSISTDDSIKIINENTSYRKKLRSSGGAQDLDENLSLFLNSGSLGDISQDESLKELTQKKLTIVDVLANEKVFAMFKSEIGQQKTVAMSLGIQKVEIKSQKIGGNLLKAHETLPELNFMFDGCFYIECVSFCYLENRICFLNLQTKLPNMKSQVEKFLSELLARSDLTLNIYEARDQLKILEKSLRSKGENLNIKINDPRVASWLIDPDTNLSWHQMVEKYCPEHLDILDLAAKHSTVSSLGLSHISQVIPKIRTSVECFLSNSLLKQQLEALKIVGNGFLVRVFQNLEMSIQITLMKMELTGFPVNQQKLQIMIEDSTSLQRQLEQHIYELNGRKFNLSSSKEVSKVVGIHQKMEGKKVSTAKNVLEKLDIPIGNCIKVWRTLEKTVSNMVPKMKLVKNGRIHGSSFSLTQTGRISMYEPNLQNVTKDFVVELKDGIKHKVSFRSAFECKPGMILLSADFCQLELRILTHLCKDVNLMKVMNSKNEDIFRKIAAKWNKMDEKDVTEVQRNQTKQICYGIIYGMGNKALAETMKVDEETSMKLATEFHAAYPGIRRYSEDVVRKTKERGYSSTLIGRRRYFPAIKSESSSDRSQAERQALNTCIQGTASDIVKNAILRMEKNMHKNQLFGCNLVLHLHDELFYEVPEVKLKKAAKILIQSMENGAPLSVPLLVKMRTGKNWGEMENFEV